MVFVFLIYFTQYDNLQFHLYCSKWHCFSKAFIQMANRHMKRCPISLVIREMQIKITMGYYAISVRMTIIKKSTNNKCWRGCEEKGIFLHCWWESKLVQPLQKTAWRFLRKLRIPLSQDPTISLLGIYPGETIIQKDTYTPLFIAALFTIAKTQKQSKCPLANEWIKKMCIYVQWTILQLYL